MNEENEWDHIISVGVKEGSPDCTKVSEVAATLKKHKTPGLSGLAAEMIGDIGTQWILDIRYL